MSISRVKTLMAAAVLAGVSALGFGSTAHASTITTTAATAACYESGTVISVDCSGYLFGGAANATPGILSITNADVWDISAVTGSNSNSEANEADFLNQVTGTTSFTGGEMNRTPGNSGSMTFSFDSLYAVIKVGAGHVVLRNDYGAAFDVMWTTLSGQGGGLSHYTLAGDLAPVPVPAAGVLLIGALGGLAMVRRRRKA